MAFTIANLNGRLPRPEEPPIASTSSRVPFVGTSRPLEHRHYTTTWDRQRCRSVTQKSRKQEREAQQIQAEEDEEAQTQQGGFAGGASRFGKLVNTLLFGAATRIERGTSVCVSCRGGGTILCQDCQASGIQGKAAPRSSGLRNTKSKEKDWMVSNRCKTCRGHGRRECPLCDGTGRRFTEWL